MNLRGRRPAQINNPEGDSFSLRVLKSRGQDVAGENQEGNFLREGKREERTTYRCHGSSGPSDAGSKRIPYKRRPRNFLTARKANSRQTQRRTRFFVYVYACCAVLE